MDGLLAVVKAFAAGYGFTKLSATSTEFIERAQRKVHDAFLAGGIFLEEDGPAEESESVPDAQFIDAAGACSKRHHQRQTHGGGTAPKNVTWIGDLLPAPSRPAHAITVAFAP
jgi:hypothetical protein